jgi:hypothetical protein
MFTSLRKKFATLAAALVLTAVPMAVPVIAGAAGADVTNNVKCGTTLQIQAGTANCDTTTSGSVTKVNSIITLIINIFSGIVGAISVVMIIWGGFKYITSGGESGKVTSAKNTIVYAVIGLVIVVFAQIFVQFVLQKITGTGA